MVEANVKKIFLSTVKGRVYFDRLFRDHTSFRIGGEARVWIEPEDLADLRRTVRLCGRLGLLIFLFGGGSNLLAKDGKIEKAVIELSHRFFKEIKSYGSRMLCGAGAPFSSVIDASLRKGLAGLEFFAGIPGTVGGAVAMNAGSPSYAIGRFVEWVKVMDYKGGLKVLKKDKLRFTYRRSNLSDSIILEVGLKLKKSDPKLLMENFNEFLHKKVRNIELNYPNAGCVFKNPHSSKLTTGRLLDLAGFKGKRIGDAQFSRHHANFIVNLGNARFSDVARLMKLAQDEVKKRFDIWLEPEIKIIS